MKHIFTVALTYLIYLNSYSQTVIAIQNFDGGTPALGFATTGGANVTGSSAAGDRPASSSFFTSATTAYSATNTTGTFTSGTVSGLGSYTSKFFDFRLASWSIASTGNGADGADNVLVEISIDGGPFTSEVRVDGNSNAFWHYSTGTGVAATTYDGDGTAVAFQPAGGGARTTDGYSTVRVDLPNSCTSAAIRVRLLNNSAGERWTVDDIRLVGTLSVPCVVGPAPTALSSNGSANPFCTSAGLTFTAGNGSNHLVVMGTSPITGIPVNATSYSSNTTFGSGSTIGAGQFVVFNGATSNFTVTGLTANTTYYVAVFEYNMTSSNCDESYNTSPLTYNFTTLNNCSTPQIRSLLADACSSQEGLDELVLIENGSNPLNISDISLAFPSGGTYCNSGCGTNTLGNNPAYITQLNTTAGCSLFAYADPIPAGATIIVFTGQTPSYVFDYSTQCPSTEVFYAIFCNNTSTAGRFANSGNAGTRTLTANFAGTPESVTYTPNLLGSDGSFVDFDDAGNPTYRTEANCIYPLGVELVNFNAAKMDQKVLLSWATLIENNSGHFNILRSTDGITFDVIGKIFAQGISHSTTHYSFEDGSPVDGLAYYQLVQIDRNGEQQYSKQIAVDLNFNEIVARYQAGNIQFNEVLLPGETVAVYTSTGQVILTQEITTVCSTLEIGLCQGIYYLQITKKGSRQARIKCPVTQ